MAWAMREPGSFGAFFPNGDLEEWEDRLKRRFDEMSPSEKAQYGGDAPGYLYHVAQKFRSGRGMLEDEEKPAELKTDRTYKDLGDLMMVVDGLLVVSEAFKDVVDAMEPGVHQFWPMRFVAPWGKPYDDTLFGMVIGSRLDSFSETDSDPASFTMTDGYPLAEYSNPKKVSGLALSRSEIGGRHLWRESRLYGLDIFFSEDLVAKLTERKMKLPKMFQVREV